MNALTNMRGTHDIDEMSVDEIAAMPVAELKALFDTNVDNLLSAQTRKKKMTQALAQKVEAAPLGTTKAQGIKITAPKSVKWDVKGLAALREEILADGGNPDVYVKEAKTLKVSEEAYKSWPDDIKGKFTPLRTVTPGSLRVEFYDDL